MGNANPTDRLRVVEDVSGTELGIAALRSWPVLFHGVHSPSIKLSHDRRRARRIDGIKGVCFSSRPICMGERVYIRITDASSSRSGALHFGFTADDPCTINAEELPRYSYPDLTNEQGYWAKTVPEVHAQRGTILFFYIVVGTGEVRFGSNGEEQGVFFNGVQTNTPLWALLDLYGSTSCVEFVDGEQISPAGSHITVSNTPVNQEFGLDPPYYMLPAVCPAAMQHASHSVPTLPVPASSFLHPGVDLVDPISFHQISGRNVILSPDHCTATRLPDEYCNGYVFTHRPIRPGERLVVTVMAVEKEYIGGLAFGVTSCDPNRLRTSDLPDDADLLLDRPEYWVVHKDVCLKPDVGDELSFHLATSGEVRYSRNRHNLCTLMHVDTSLPLWIFLDIYGSTKELKSIGVFITPLVRSPHHDPHCRHSMLTTQHNNHLSMRPSSEPRLNIEGMEGGRNGSRTLVMSRLSMEPSDTTNAGRQSVSPIVLHHCRGSGDNGHSGRTIVIRPAYDSSNLISKHSSIAHPSPRKLSTSSTPIDTPLESLQLPPPLIPVPAGGSSAKEQRSRMKQPPSRRSHPHISPLHCATDSNLEIPVSPQNPPPVPSRKSIPTLRDRTVSQLSSPSSVLPEPVEKKNESMEAVEAQSSECVVCLERAPDCVLYTCGHMCMCYQCAEDVVKNRGALCPICRQSIRDIIKIYRS